MKSMDFTIATRFVQIHPIHLKDTTMNNFRRSLLCLSSASLVGLGAFGTRAIAATPIALTTQLSGASEVPPVMTNATGILEATLTPDTNVLMWKITYSGLSGPLTGAHFHGAAMPGQNAAVVVPITGSLTSPIHGSATLSPSQAADIVAGTWYVNLHTVSNPNGEARGQVNARP
jgi:hypothetical protein